MKSEVGIKAATRWVDAVQVLSTDTDKMVIKELSYESAGGGDVSSRVEQKTAKSPGDLRRHPPQPGVLKQMVEPLHQILRDFFDEQVGKGSVVTPSVFVKQLSKLLPELLWDGQLDTDRTEFSSEDEGAVEVAGLLGMDTSGPWTMEEFEKAAQKRVGDIIDALENAAGNIS